jgi:hypothetical protein
MKMENVLNASVALGILLFVTSLPMAISERNKQKKSEYVTGTVLKERGTVTQEVNGENYKNNVNVDHRSYVLEIQFPDGKYTASIYDSWGYKPLEALALAIEEGSQIQVKKENLDGSNRRFRVDKIGYLKTDDIIVLDKK